VVISIAFDAKGKLMATLAKDRNIRIFNFLTGKVIKKIDESIDVYSSIQQVFKIMNFQYYLIILV
jgi:hypothetical protein